MFCSHHVPFPAALPEAESDLDMLYKTNIIDKNGDPAGITHESA
jgi:hypothetical protein